MTTAREYIEDGIARFQERRKKCLARYFYPGMSFLLIGIASLLLEHKRIAMACILLFMFLFFVGGFKYRCPFCSKTPYSSAGGEGGFDFDPQECPKCGLRLKHKNNV